MANGEAANLVLGPQVGVTLVEPWLGRRVEQLARPEGAWFSPADEAGDGRTLVGQGAGRAEPLAGRPRLGKSCAMGGDLGAAAE